MTIYAEVQHLTVFSLSPSGGDHQSKHPKARCPLPHRHPIFHATITIMRDTAQQNIMNSNPESKSSYTLLPVQSSLLQAGIPVQRDSYLPAINKLQLTILRRRLFIKSIHDSHEYLRIMLFGLLMYAYTCKPELLNTFKRVVYGGSQSGDSSFKDGKLVKIINEVPFDGGIDTEHAVMKIFVDITDMEVLTPCLEMMNDEGQGYERLDQCKQWIQDKFGVEINILHVGDPPSSNICFYEENGALLKTSLQDIDSLEGVSLGSDVDTPTSSVLNTHSGSKKRFSDAIDLSLTKQNMSPDGQSHHVHFLLDSEVPEEGSQLPTPKSQIMQHHAKEPRKRSFSIWDYLCC